MKNQLFVLLALSSLCFLSCNKNPDDNSINLFSISDDIELGAQVDSTILANPAEYPVLSPSQYPQAYSYVLGIRDKILNTGKVFYKDKFEWEVKIINDDATLNAFCTPGGYIYVYTGLIKYLDSEDEFAGVLGHEMAHADRRHSTDGLTEQYGITFLLQFILGKNQNQLTDIAASLASLKFSRSRETEADNFSVTYLCPTTYNAAGAAGFFEKLIADQQAGGTPQFLSTHPNPDNRVANINGKKSELGCSGSATNDQAYQAFKNSLP